MPTEMTGGEQEPASAAAERPEAETEVEGPFGIEPARWLEAGILRVPYIPDFRADELVLYFAPDRREPRAAYHSLPPRALDRWSGYFTKKGWRFIHTAPEERGAEGPFRVQPGKLRIEILETGRFFLPRPRFVILPEGTEVPVVSLEKRRPFDPWKPTYIRALNFIKKYEWPRPVPKAVEYCIEEIEECGEVAGSTAWENAERILAERVRESADTRAVLADIFERRPEDFPLGSEVYLRVLGRSGEEGFQIACGLHRHPQRLKRKHVALALGRLRRRESLETLLRLHEDEDLEVRDEALCAIGKVGVAADHPAAERLRGLLEAPDVRHRVWAAEALLRGGDENQQKLLIQLVKETPAPLHDMGELGQILVDLQIVQAVPFLVHRLKSERVELRDDAAETLRGLTGLDIEFHGHDDENQRRLAIRQWDRWWDDYKRTRKR